jgi:hypothetical protein
MQIIEEKFQSTVKEIEIYIDYVQKSQEGIFFKDSINLELEAQLLSETKLVHNILIANGYLLLYNLIEATIRSICESLHKTILRDGINYNSLSDEYKSLWLLFRVQHSGMKNHNSSCISLELRRIINQVLEENIVDLEGIFRLQYLELGGNITHSKVLKIAKMYGFKNLISNRISRTIEETINDIRIKRNDLAHGNKSFSDLGKNVSAQQLNKEFLSIKKYLSKLIGGIKQFLKTKQYLNNKHRSSKKTSNIISK